MGLTCGLAQRTKRWAPELGEPPNPASAPGFCVLGSPMSQAAPSGWYLRAGRERDHRYAILVDDGVTWTQVRDAATRFETKASATVEQLDLVAALGIQVSAVSDCPKARQQDEAIAMMRAGPGLLRPDEHSEAV